jgi:hypothetical protein
VNTSPTTSHRRRYLAAAILAVGLAWSAGNLAAGDGDGDAQRVAFAAGTDNATVSGSLAPGTTASYVLRASAGQTLDVSLGPAEFAALTTIFGPGGDVVGAGHTTASANQPVDGDYIVEIGNTGNTTDFTATFRIPAGSSAPAPAPSPPAPAPAPGGAQRIQFASGTDNATVSGSLAPGATASYVLRASAGQEMIVTLGPDEFAARTTISGVDGGIFGSGDTRAVAGLTVTGDYIVEIENTGTTTEYTATFRIPASTSSPAPGPGPAPAPGGAERIQFAGGTDSAIVEGTFRAGQSDRYVLRASAGQEMTTVVKPPDSGAGVSVIAPDGSELPGGPGDTGNIATHRLPVSGDYTIVVGGGSSGAYTLEVIIPPLSRRIEFAPGTNNASLEDSVGTTQNRYVLRGSTGQTMAVQIDAAADNARFDVIAPDGTLLAVFETQSTVVLPSSGDYTVKAYAFRESPGAVYRISFWIV